MILTLKSLWPELHESKIFRLNFIWGPSYVRHVEAVQPRSKKKSCWRFSWSSLAFQSSPGSSHSGRFWGPLIPAVTEPSSQQSPDPVIPVVSRPSQSGRLHAIIFQPSLSLLIPSVTVPFLIQNHKKHDLGSDIEIR